MLVPGPAPYNRGVLRGVPAVCGYAALLRPGLQTSPCVQLRSALETLLLIRSRVFSFSSLDRLGMISCYRS